MTHSASHVLPLHGRSIARLAVSCGAGLLLAACASLSPEQCVSADWRQIGFSDGANGLSAARINDHAKACADLGIRPRLDEYLRGREQGLRSYCQAENGFAVGRQGLTPGVGDCPEPMKPAFLEQYRRGYQVHLIEQDLAERRARLERNDYRMRRSNERIAAIRSELSSGGLPAERRNALLNEFNRLVEEKNALARENALLFAQTGRLQMHLQMQLHSYGY